MHAPKDSIPSAALPPTSGAAFYAVLFLGVLAGAGAFVWGWLPKVKNHVQVIAQTRDLAAIRVRVATLAPAPAGIPVAFPGELKPAMEASILARVTGYVRDWQAELGDRVAAGQVLATLDTPELQREIARAESQLALAEAAHKLAETTAKRWQELYAAKTASSQEADEKQADLALKEAAVGAARAELQRLQQIAGFATITAPFAGTITARKVDVGQLVEAGGSKELFHLSETAKLRVFVRIPQAYAASIRVGQAAQIVVPELRGKPLEAKIIRTAGAIDPASRSLLTELEVDNASGVLLAGGFAQILLPSAQSAHPKTVAANALISRAEGTLLAVVDATGTVRLQKVTIGRDFGSSVEIVDGIESDARVILNPPDSISDGVKVEVVE